MNLDFFVTFLSVIQTKSFTKAAHLTNLSQSTVSNRIIELEKHFDCQLFTRHMGRVEATQQGLDLVPMAEELVMTYNTAKNKLKSKDDHSTSIRIGSVHAFFDVALDPFLETHLFKDNTRAINLFLKHSNEIIQGVVSGKYDIGFTRHISNYSKFTSKLLFTDDLIFVGPSKLEGFEDGLPFSELEKLNVIHSHLFDNYVDDILYSNKTYGFSIDISSRIIPLLIKHNAFAYLPKTLVKPYLEEASLFVYKILDYSLPPLEHYIIYPREFDTEAHPLNTFIQSIIRFVQSNDFC